MEGGSLVAASPICTFVPGLPQLLELSKIRWAHKSESIGSKQITIALYPLVLISSLLVCFAAHSHYLYGYTLAAFRE